MASYHKCPLCGELITKDEVGPIKYKSINKYFHKACYQSYLKGISKQKTTQSKEKPKATKRKPQAETSRSVSEEEYQDKKRFYDYLRKIGVEPTAKEYTLADKYIAQFSMDFKGMLDCLQYLVDIKKMEITGVGIIPYYYDETKRYYEGLKKIEDSNAGANPEYREKVVTIQRPSNKKRKEIDF